MEANANGKPIAVLIADDHAIFRDGLRRLLEAEAEFRVAGEASDGLEAIDMAIRLKPRVVLLDLAMPRMTGMDALSNLAQPGMPQTIVLTANANRGELLEALRRGACGVVVKDSATQVLLEAIRTVTAGDYWFIDEPVRDLPAFLKRSQAQRPDHGLTPRELQIVEAIVGGLSNKDIAKRFVLSEDTVKHHLSNIFQKLKLSSRLELALFALEHKLARQSERQAS